jgi:hypothetical protein
MKIILLASAIWLLLCFLMVVFWGSFTKFIGRRHRQRSNGPSPAIMRAYGYLDEVTTKRHTPRENTTPPSMHKEARTTSGLQLLAEKYVTQIKELETRIADAKHKVEVVTEASRLLEEEGLSDDSPTPIAKKRTTWNKLHE